MKRSLSPLENQGGENSPGPKEEKGKKNPWWKKRIPKKTPKTRATAQRSLANGKHGGGRKKGFESNCFKRKPLRGKEKGRSEEYA